ncbi:MAG: LysR family transcriptional regulator [Rhodospirillales bacterium]|nr:LysR family transcriptional regulator [Rhodospirillales bacterium]
MNWDHIRIFLAVARTGQFLAAARQLRIDHTTVGRRIGKLEDDLSARLFDRRTDGCVLTSAGERLLTVAERMESEILTGAELLEQEEVSLTGTVRVGAPDGVGSYFLAPRLAALAQRHPELTVQLVPLPRSFSLSRREADIAVTVERPTEGRLIVSKLVDYGVSLYVARDYRQIESPDDLAECTLITYVDDLLYSQALDYSRMLENPPARQFECASVVGQVEAVRAGAGVGLLHDHIAQRYPELTRVLPEIGAQRSYWLVSHADVRDLARVATLWDFIVTEMRSARRSFIRAD